MSTFENSEDPDEMQHNAAFHQGLHFVKVKRDFRKKSSIFFKLYPDTPDIQNGLSKVYCIKPEGRIH